MSVPQIPTVWTRHIADSLQVVDLAPHARTWSGIDATSVARMRLQNRFQSGLDIARYTAAIMRRRDRSMASERIRAFT